jgi:hypothetical protein
MISARFSPIRRTAAAVHLAGLVLGCQGKGDASGKATYQDRPLVYGAVLIVRNPGVVALRRYASLLPAARPSVTTALEERDDA